MAMACAHLPLRLDERREERSSDLGDGLLVGHLDAIVEGLGAGDAVLLAVHDEATEAGVLHVRFVPLGEEVILVDLDFARDVLSAGECLHL